MIFPYDRTLAQVIVYKNMCFPFFTQCEHVLLKRIKNFPGMKSGLRSELAHGSIGSLAVKVLGTGLGFLVAVVLARGLGAEGYGVYSYVFALVSLVAIPAQLGLPQLVVRETAKAHAQEQWGLMRGLWRWATIVVGAISIGLTLIALLLGWLFSEQLNTTQIATFAFGILLVPLIALGNLRGAALSGLRRIVQGQLPELVLRPGFFVVMLILIVIMVPEATLHPGMAMGLHVLAAALAFGIGAAMLWRSRPEGLRNQPESVYDSRKWFGSTLPLAFVDGMTLINQHTDILMLGLFLKAEEVGIYKVAVSVATLVAFGLQAVTMALSPHFARLYAQNDMARLQRIVTLSARVILLLALPVVLVLVVFGNLLIGLIFGAEFSSGSLPLAILAIGQLVNAAMGSVGALLNMTGHERETARGVAIAAGSNVLFNLAFIPLMGMNGAAMATALSMMLWNLLLWRAVRHRLGIESMAFSISFIGKQ